MGIKPLPRDVYIPERDNKTESIGQVIDEVILDSSYEWGDFRRLIQLIEWEDKSKSIRFGYYVKDHDAPDSDYIWGSQNALIIDFEDAEVFLKNALENLIYKYK